MEFIIVQSRSCTRDFVGGLVHPTRLPWPTGESSRQLCALIGAACLTIMQQTHELLLSSLQDIGKSLVCGYLPRRCRRAFAA